MRRIVFAVATVMAMASGAHADTACTFTPAEAAWTKQALSAWALVRDTRLHIVQTIKPALILFDDKCTFDFAPETDTPSKSAAHNGKVDLPDGQTVPAQPIAFASRAEDGSPFFVMALPPIWDKALKTTEKEKLTLGVFVHEFSHTQQMSGLGGRFDDLGKAGVLPPDADDDFIQTRFESNADFTKSVEQERDLLFEAADAPSLDEVRRIASEALSIGDERAKKWLSGKDAALAEVEDLFLTFEGAGDWSAYAYLSDPQGGAMQPAQAKELIRGTRRPWSQDLGLALFLVLERLSPGATAKAYGDTPETIAELLRDALMQ